MKSDLLDLAMAPAWTEPRARPTSPPARLTVSLATPEDRDLIYRSRHDIYGLELGQHSTNGDGRLTDALDQWNVYLVAKLGTELAGFISITPPSAPSYSIDKYFPRQSLSIVFDHTLYEIRLLTVLQKHRGRELATLLMYAAFRWVESHGGRHIVAIGRREILELYLRSGLQRTGLSTKS